MILSEKNMISEIQQTWASTFTKNLTKITLKTSPFDDQEADSFEPVYIERVVNGFFMRREDGFYNSRKASVGDTLDQQFSQVISLKIYFFETFTLAELVPKTEITVHVVSGYGDDFKMTVETINRIDTGEIYKITGAINSS